MQTADPASDAPGMRGLRALDRAFLALAAVSGALATLAGASATHGREAGTAGADLLRTGSSYGFWHGLMLIGLVLVRPRLAGRGARLADIAGFAFAAGLILFCGALYGLALGAPSAVAFGAPVGGSAFILGWIGFGLAVILGGRPGLKGDGYDQGHEREPG